MSDTSHTDQDGGFLARWSRRKAQVRQGGPVAEPAPVANGGRPGAPSTSSTAVAATGVAQAQASTPPSLLPSARMEAAATQPSPQPVPAVADAAELPPAPTPPTLADVAELTRESDYSRFVGRGVEPQVRNAALKKLFTDPHFNIMDGLDTYIDDYGRPDPIPESMLRQMAQSKFLGLFQEEEAQEAAAEAEAARQAHAQPATHGNASGTEASGPDALNASPIPNQTDTCTATTPDENSDLRLQPHAAAGRSGPEPGAGQDAGREC